VNTSIRSSLEVLPLRKPRSTKTWYAKNCNTMALSTLSTSLPSRIQQLLNFAVQTETGIRILSYIKNYCFPAKLKTSIAEGAIAIVLSPEAATAGCIIGAGIIILALLHPEVRKVLASTALGALGGASAAFTLFSTSTSTANGTANAFAYAGGTAEAIKDGIAFAIGKGACAKAVNDVVLAIGPAVATGLTVGGIVGLLVYLVCKFYFS